MNETPNDYFSAPDQGMHDRRSPWHENQGNLLAGFTLLIVVVGSGVLACRQLQFVPPKFPDGRSIPAPDETVPPNPDENASSAMTGQRIDASRENDPVASRTAEPKQRAANTMPSSAKPSASEQPSFASDGASITVEATGAGDSRGTAMFAIYDSANGFNQTEKAIRRQRAPIQQGKAFLKLPMNELPARFAVAVYHDQNGNGLLDRNALGIPSERYGFSNNARSLTGPPAYSKAVVERPAAGGQIEIRIR